MSSTYFQLADSLIVDLKEIAMIGVEGKSMIITLKNNSVTSTFNFPSSEEAIRILAEFKKAFASLG